MRITTIAQELVSVRPMSPKEYKAFMKRTEKEHANLEKIFIRKVLFEKHLRIPCFDLSLFKCRKLR